MNAYPTPIPTPRLVQLLGALLGGGAIGLLTSGLAVGFKAPAALLGLAAALLITLSHPYRRELRAFRAARGLPHIPAPGQAVMLFLIWLAFMLAPVVAPLPAWGATLTGLLSALLLYVVYPHADGTRVLAFSDALEM